jgi:hypothetical protein
MNKDVLIRYMNVLIDSQPDLDRRFLTHEKTYSMTAEKWLTKAFDACNQALQYFHGTKRSSLRRRYKRIYDDYEHTIDIFGQPSYDNVRRTGLLMRDLAELL